MTNPKRILVLSPELKSIGGIQKYNKDLIATLKKIKYKVFLSERKEGFIKSKILFIFRTSILVFTRAPELIICSHINYSIIPLILNLIFNKKFILIFYGIDAMNIKNKIYIRAINESYKIIVISDYTKNILTKQFKINENKFFILPSAVDKKKFKLINNIKKIKNKYNLSSGPVILTISRLSTNEEKGHNRVLLALKKVLKKYPNCKYIIAGPGEDRRVDKILSENPDIEKATIRLGRISEEEKNILYNLCDVFILLSKNEGFGIVFIEALICGSTVLSSNKYGCPEILVDKGLGYVVNPDNITEIHNKINYLIKRSKKIKIRDKQILRNNAISEFDISTWHKKIHNLLNLTKGS